MNVERILGYMPKRIWASLLLRGETGKLNYTHTLAAVWVVVQTRVTRTPFFPQASLLNICRTSAAPSEAIVGTSGTRFSCKVISRPESQDLEPNIHTKPEWQQIPPASNGRPSQKIRGYYSNNGPINFILIPVILK